MDGRLLEAARTGNKEMLLELLHEDPSILATSVLASGDTLLHITSLFGRVDIATQILQLQPSFCLELNQDGHSPMHIASAHGHLELVKLFIEFGRDRSILDQLCMQRNIHGKIPLHCAVIKGRVDVMGALLTACPESAPELTDQGEMVLHLAVKYNQRDAFWFLIQEPNNKQLVNFTDVEGNTILHLATARRQYQIMSFLLQEPNLTVNAVNSRGQTPLDVLEMTPSQWNDVELGEMLRGAGGERKQNPQLSTTQVQVSADTNETIRRQISDPYQKKKLGRERVMEMRNGIMMMASLTAAMTFQAALAPPGGFWGDWIDNNSNNTTATAFNTTSPPAHKPGSVVMYDLNRKEFTSFLFWDSIGFLASLSIILSLIVPMPFKNDSTRWEVVQYSIFAVVISVLVVFMEAVQLTTNKKIYSQKNFAVFIVYLIIWLTFGFAALVHGFSKMKDESEESDTD